MGFWVPVSFGGLKRPSIVGFSAVESAQNFMGRRNVYRVLEGCRIRLACKGILGMFGVEGLLQALSTREQDNTF